MHHQKFRMNIATFILVNVLIPGVMPNSLAVINPWLSACDLAYPMQTELLGTCSQPPNRPVSKKWETVGDMVCPKPCPLNQSTSSNPKCLAYLDDTRKNAICNFSKVSGRQWLKTLLGQIRLRHCCEHTVIGSLHGTLLEMVYRGEEECFDVINHLAKVDELAAAITCNFGEVLARFDCGHTYSVNYSCRDCEEAYRRWVCSTLLPIFNGTQRVRPCLGICHGVEQKCPYFLPENRAPWLPTQYAGEPLFLCVDPNIAESKDQQARSIYPTRDSCCAKYCGFPHEGMCITPGPRCDADSNYENALQEDCSASDDYNLIRPPNGGRCSRGSSLRPRSRTLLDSVSIPRPILLSISTFLILQASHPHSNHHFLLPSLLPIPCALHSPSLGIILLLTYLYFATLLPIDSLVNRNSYYHLLKGFKFILSYIILNFNKWQNFFARLSANLRPQRNPLPRAPMLGYPPSHGTRYWVRAKNNNPGQCKRYRIKTLPMRKNLFGLKPKNRKPLIDCLVTGTMATNECGIGIKCNSSAVNAMKRDGMMVLKTLPLKISHRALKRKKREPRRLIIKHVVKRNYSRSYLNVKPLLKLMNSPIMRMNPVYKIILIFLHGSKTYKYLHYYLKKYKGNLTDKKYGKKIGRGEVPARLAAVAGYNFPSRKFAIAKI